MAKPGLRRRKIQYWYIRYKVAGQKSQYVDLVAVSIRDVGRLCRQIAGGKAKITACVKIGEEVWPEYAIKAWRKLMAKSNELRTHASI